MNEIRVNNRYARALFQLAKKAGNHAEIDLWLRRLTEGLMCHPGATRLIRNPTISEQEKIHFIEKLFPEGTPPLLKNFCKVLIEKKRFCILPEVQKIFHAMHEREEGILEVELLSVVPFSEKILEKLKKMLAAKLRFEIRLIPKIEASLVGGFLLRFDGKEIDCSFKNRFHEIAQQLIV